MTFGIAELDRLIALLKDADISAAPDQVLAAHDLLLRLTLAHTAPTSLAQWRPLLAPVFCRSPEEQERFYRLFDRWAGEPAPVPKGSDTIPPLPDEPHWRLRHTLTLIVIIAAIAVGVMLRPPQPIERVEVPTEAPAQSPANDSAQATPPRAERRPAGDASLDFVFPRPPERIEPRLHAPGAAAVTARELRWALVPLPLLILIGALFWVLFRRKLVLTRGSDTTPPEPHRFPVRGAQDGLFATHRLRPTIDRLRAAGRIPMREIDARRTVDMTLRRAGFFTPVFRTRRHVPDYVVLLDRRRPADHLAAFARTLIERLRCEALAVSVYYFSGDPRRCQAEDRPVLSQTLDDIEALHANARLIIVSDGAGFFNPFTAQLERWTTQLERWTSRALMTPTPSRQWGYAEFLFALNGYAVTTLDAAGIDAVARWMLAMSGVEDDALEVAPLLREGVSARTLPKVIERHFDEWSSRKPPPDVDIAAVIDAVKRYLGPQGYLVLCALAMYPQVTWPLTLFLDSRLAPADEAVGERERRVLALARLPWLRDAHMPDYLRLVLIRSLSAESERQIRALYQALFESADDAGPNAIELTVDRPPSGEVRRRLARIFSAPPAAGPYTDRIFAQVLLFGKPGRLDIELPRQVDRLLPAARWPRAIMLSIGALVVSTIVGLLAYIATAPLESRIATRLLAWERDHNTKVQVVVSYPQAREQQAQALAATLTDWGFRASAVRRNDAGAGISENELTDSPAIDRYTKDWLVQRIAYFSYGVAPRMRSGDALDRSVGGSSLVINLADTLPESFNFREGERTEHSGAAMIFEDRLAKGGLGPQMVIVPSGTAAGAPDATQYDRPVLQSAVLSRPVAFGRYEVTVGEFRRFVDATGYRTIAEQQNRGCYSAEPRRVGAPAVTDSQMSIDTMVPIGNITWRSPGFTQTDADPVVCVGWSDANAYVQWLSEQTGMRYRLPTNTEWTYAALALHSGMTRASIAADTCAFANVAETVSGCGDRFAHTAPVGSFRSSSAFELADMFGNVMELATCDDRYRGAERVVQQAQTDARACDAGYIRGSDWSRAGLIAGTDGARFNLDEGDNRVGFRVVRDLDSWLVTGQEDPPTPAEPGPGRARPRRR